MSKKICLIFRGLVIMGFFFLSFYFFRSLYEYSISNQDLLEFVLRDSQIWINTIFYLISALLFWGIFRFRRWTLPVVFLMFLGSTIALLTIITLYSYESLFNPDFGAVIHVLIITIGGLAFILRKQFVGPVRRLFVQVPFFMVYIPLLFLASLNLFFPDIPEVDDSDLAQLQSAPLADKDNAYFLLESIRGTIYSPTGDEKERYQDFLTGVAWNKAEVDAILKANAETLDILQNAAKLSRYDCRDEEGYCTFSQHLQGVRLVSLLALSQIKSGEYKAALEDVFDVLDLGQMVMQNKNSGFAGYIVGFAVKNIGLTTLQQMVTKYDIPPDILLPRISDLEQYRINDEILEHVFIMEYNGQKKILKEIPNVKSFYTQINRALRDMAEQTRENIKISHIQCKNLEPILLEYKKKYMEYTAEIPIWKLIFTRNAVFRIIQKGASVDYTKLYTKRCQQNALIDDIRHEMASRAIQSRE